ncbi:hypothetical protein OK016_19810 [Vibrio chagasii]|nr:hypothetical protein [Vibrio chagasii]
MALISKRVKDNMGSYSRYRGDRLDKPTTFHYEGIANTMTFKQKKPTSKH